MTSRLATGKPLTFFFSVKLSAVFLRRTSIISIYVSILLNTKMLEIDGTDCQPGAPEGGGGGGGWLGEDGSGNAGGEARIKIFNIYQKMNSAQQPRKYHIVLLIFILFYQVAGLGS